MSCSMLHATQLITQIAPILRNWRPTGVPPATRTGEPGQNTVLAFVPALRTAPQVLVIDLPRLLDESLEVDVATDLDSVVVEGEEAQKPRDASVAVSKRVDAKDIEGEARDGDERGHPLLIYGVAIRETEFLGRGRRLIRVDRPRARDGGLARPDLRDLVLEFASFPSPDGW